MSDDAISGSGSLQADGGETGEVSVDGTDRSCRNCDRVSIRHVLTDHCPHCGVLDPLKEADSS